MTPKTIRLFIKPWCPWCIEAVEWFDAKGWPYEKFDVTSGAAARQEMFELTDQTRAPSVEIDGHVLADFGTDELEEFLKRLDYQ